MEKNHYNIHEAKTNFSKLVDKAMAGETVIIAKNGVPQLTLKPVKPVKKAKKWATGFLKDKIKMHDDFDLPLPDDIAEAFGIK